MARNRLTASVERAIQAASDRYNLDPEWMRRIARLESSYNPTARNGSYRGLYQLSEREFNRISPGGNIDSPEDNALAAAGLMASNRDAFRRRYQHDPSIGELYLMHNQGLGGAFAHIDNPDAPAWQNMAGTREGRGRRDGPAWARRAIAGNRLGGARGQNPETMTSREFLGGINTHFTPVADMPGTGDGRTTPDPTPIEPGNIDLSNRRVIRNPDGSISTLRSITIGSGDRHIVIPTITPDGNSMTPDEAVGHYRMTGQHLGVFGSQGDAETFARRLSERQGARYRNQPDPVADSLGLTPGRAEAQLPGGVDWGSRGMADRFSGAEGPGALGVTPAETSSLGDIFSRNYPGTYALTGQDKPLGQVMFGIEAPGNKRIGAALSSIGSNLARQPLPQVTIPGTGGETSEDLREARDAFVLPSPRRRRPA